MGEHDAVALARVQERLGAIQGSVDKAHARIDIVQKEVKDELILISSDVKLLLADMHTKKGSKAAWMLVATLAIGLIGALAKIFTH